MAATGVSGLDLYVKTARGDWHWLAVGKPESVSNQVSLINNLPPGRREFLLYLPLYNGTASAEIGVPPGATISRAGAWGPGTRKPIVFYGTSILQGACASRPGMVHCAMLGRQFQFPHINLGFSGNGRMEPEVADLLAELDPSVYVLDCLPNMDAAEVTARYVGFRPDDAWGYATTSSRSGEFEIQPNHRYPDAGRMAFDLRRAGLSMGVGDGRVFLRTTMRDLLGAPAIDGEPTNPEARAATESGEIVTYRFPAPREFILSTRFTF